jgi:2',3'-cyclic-nucleotide 2'-phosphodiesterase (5'-nucleotidase family)
MARRYLVAVVLVLVLVAAALAGSAEEAKPQDPVFTIGAKDGGKQETSLGDLTTDAIRAAMKTQIAFLAASELKNLDPPVPAQTLKLDQLKPAISFPDDPLTVLQLTGKEVRAALERSVSLYPQRNLGFLQVSGLKFTIDPGKKSGSRVSAVIVGKEELKDDATYTVTVTNSIANGALGYWNVWSAGSVLKRDPEQSLKKALDAYLKTSPKLEYKVPSRITIASQPTT